MSTYGHDDSLTVSAPRPRGWDRLGCLSVMAVVTLFWLAVFGTGAWLASLSAPPVCEEDEVLLHSGACHPLDDSEYMGGTGWVDITHARR